ncbi:MAG: tetratricopeptide repeat protein [Phycisphaerales bacterium]|nr:MAG: tetratricopeptide repeat protein [Phycisphaerales bacterium]
MPSIEQLERLLKVDENDAFVHYALAMEHTKAGEGSLALAIEHFDRCLAIDPNYLYAYYHKARVLIEAGRNGEGAEILRAGLAKAREARDGKAMGEMEGLLDSIS